MAAHLILERTAFPVGVAPSAPVTPAEEIAAEGSAAARAGLASGLMLALRFVQARFLSVWGLLAAAALCPAQVFADFAVFSALANFVSIATLLRFEAVFFQSSDQDRLARAFRLALAAGGAFLTVAALGIAVAGAAGWVVATYGALFLVSLAGRAVIRLVSSEATAEGDFAAIGNSNVVQALVQPGMMVLLIWPLGATSVALFAADAIGHVVSACYLVWRRRAALAGLVRREVWSRLELRESASRWRTAPRFLLPSALLSFGFMVAPLLALPYASNPLLAAHVALAMRLLEVPTQMFSAVSVPLVLSSLRARAAESRQAWVRFVTLGLMVAAAALFAAIALVAMGADVVLDGTQWEGVGETVAIMALFYGGIALVTPLHEIASLSRSPRRQVLTNAIALLAAGLVMAWFGTLSLALLGAIGLVSLARMLAHVQFAWTRFGVDGFAVARG
ncbi:hypothetical protein SAMN05216304_104351 [Bosea sp. OK403]|uniref:hypothetical protein n=1 Tax=Bosea sp. OK403 TaxID=1855286 RepID=UPI0008F16A40|nr:hypothetical protein [Bosea sp. OK403]SFJ07926.1 hypothetical protein SAMN05216304_104351 [Bosea sp. OK403]